MIVSSSFTSFSLVIVEQHISLLDIFLFNYGNFINSSEVGSFMWESVKWAYQRK